MHWPTWVEGRGRARGPTGKGAPLRQEQASTTSNPLLPARSVAPPIPRNPAKGAQCAWAPRLLQLAGSKHTTLPPRPRLRPRQSSAGGLRPRQPAGPLTALLPALTRASEAESVSFSARISCAACSRGGRRAAGPPVSGHSVAPHRAPVNSHAQTGLGRTVALAAAASASWQGRGPAGPRPGAPSGRMAQVTCSSPYTPLSYASQRASASVRPASDAARPSSRSEARARSLPSDVSSSAARRRSADSSSDCGWCQQAVA